MLKEWEKALESAQAAQLKLASLDPAKNSSGLVSIWYTFDPLKTRDTTIAPLQALLACVRAPVCVCVCACAYARVRMRVCMCACACVRVHAAVCKGKGMGAHALM